ncbi:MAG: cation-translocating P-type ATPase [Deltaproteobacteria bacterium]|nr:cation-translocating P-type ATPase [Deltaproteobacteria bacterium]
MMTAPGPTMDRAFRGPVVSPVSCPGCGKLVDPLRAGHVAIFHDRFFYFCEWTCRQDYLARDPEGPEPPRSVQPLPTRSSRPPPAAHQVVIRPAPEAERGAGAGAEGPAREALEADQLDAEQDLGASTGGESSVAGSDIGTLLLLSATVAGVLAVALALVGTSATVLTIRLVVGCVGTALLAARAFVVSRDPADPHPTVVLVPAGASAMLAIWSRIVRDPIADEAAILTGLTVVAAGTAIQLVEHVRRDATATLAHIVNALDAPARKVVPSGYSIVPAASLRPGEEIVVDASEMVPADVMISAGEATVLPWLDAVSAARKTPGDSLVAGAKVLTGRVRATVAWNCLDRAWLRTSADPTRAAHVVAPIVRLARIVTERGSLAAAALAGLAAFVNNAKPPMVILSMLAAHLAVASMATAAIPSLHVLRSVLDTLARGVSYFDAQAWDRAAQATVMVFCARGTLLLGEPQVAEIVRLGNATPEHLLSLVAGAELAASGPIASAVLREARARSVRADSVRSPTVVPGLGVTAIASNGEPCCVGSRVLMLNQHIPIAAVESKLAELEAHGRTVLLVAVSSKLIGMVALQDGLRPGARASVQYLLDAHVEPVLLSGDARETCEAIARSLDIEHVRPEVLPSDRAGEIKRIAESGAMVAVVGRAGVDDSALGAADVAVALEAAGSTLGEWSVALAGDDVRDAARALVSARRTRVHARTALGLGLAPGIACALAIAFGLVPAPYAPLAMLVGAILAYLHARAVDIPDRDRRRT